jgi:aminomethyltransferase
MTLKHTPLYEEHINAGAKMGEFAGWEMPLYYGSQLEEHRLVREDAGMFDVSHMTIIDLKGKGARDFLRHLIANDVDKLKEIGKALYGCMLNENGGIVDDLIVYKYNEQDYRLVVNAGTHDKDVAWINQHKTSFDVETFEHKDFAMIAIQGPNAIAKTQEVFNHEQKAATKDLKVFYGVEVNGWWIARTGYTGEDGYEIMVPTNEARAFWRSLVKVGVAPCGLVARDSLRLEAGLSLYGSDMTEETSPLESNLEWTIAWEPATRNFIGRKAIEDQKKSGVKRNIYGIVLAKGAGILRSHQKVIIDNGATGETTSGGFSPTLGHAIALARLPTTVKIGDQVFVEIRDKKIPAKVVKASFVRKGKPVF